MELRKTEQRLLDAVSQIIEDEGFTKIGINRIAKNALCDKVLIYRYFGGLDGLLSAWAKKHDFYTFAYTSFYDRIQQATSEDIKDIAKEVLLGQLKNLRNNTTTQELLVWELSGNSSFDAIRKERESNGFKLQIELEKRFEKVIESCNIHVTILVAAINYIVLSARQYNKFNGIDFNDSQSWEALEKAICKYIDLLFNSSEK